MAIINYTRAPKQNLQDMQTQVILFFRFLKRSIYKRWKELGPGWLDGDKQREGRQGKITYCPTFSLIPQLQLFAPCPGLFGWAPPLHNAPLLTNLSNHLATTCAQVWLVGHSAGSHLSAMLLSSPWYDGLPNAARKVSLIISL